MAASNAPSTDLARAEILWKAADALRGQIDAAEHKHVVLGLLFLKYISDSFEARRDELKVVQEADGIAGPQLQSLLENRDEWLWRNSGGWDCGSGGACERADAPSIEEPNIAFRLVE